MKDKSNCSHYLAEIHGTWISNENDYKYGFHLVEYEKTKDVYQLKLAKGKNLFDSETHSYKIWSDNEKYFLDFLETTKEIISLDTTLEIPEMELKYKNGKIVKYLKSKEMIF